MKRGQTSIEYVLAMVGLMILLVALYEVSISMGQRVSAMQTRMEGTRLAAQMGQALDWAEVIGPGAQINISFYSFPAQHLSLKGGEIVVLDENEQAAAFGRQLGMMEAPTTRYGNESVEIDNPSGGDGHLTVSGIGG